MSVWTSAEFDDHEQVCFFSDASVGLRAIVAIHSTALGPAAGGTRFKAYGADELAVADALRLSRAMSYKCALAGLPIGGGKAVVIGDPARIKTRQLLLAFGRFIDRIGNMFATGVDVGTTVSDMEVVGEATRYVGAGSDDTAINTAAGVVHGLRAVLRHRFARDDFTGVKVAIQGLGAVGWRLAERLHANGAELLVCDLRAEKVEAARARFGAASVPVDAIHKAEVDIYAPCALGGVVNAATVREIRARAVAGAANNQIDRPEAGAALAERGILYAPDYVINAGGVIGALEVAIHLPGRPNVAVKPLESRLAAIGERLGEIFARAGAERRPPEAVADQAARELIGR